jgi:hypothetical protein
MNKTIISQVIKNIPFPHASRDSHSFAGSTDEHEKGHSVYTTVCTVGIENALRRLTEFSLPDKVNTGHITIYSPVGHQTRRK